MNEGPQNWLYTPRVSGDPQVTALGKTPVVAYPFGRSAEPESSSSDNITDVPNARSRVSVEDPRIIHGRIAASAEVDTAGNGEQNELDAASQADVDSVLDSPLSLLGHDRVEGANPMEAPTARGDNTAEDSVEPMPEAQAVAKVRKHILGSDSGKDRGSSGRLVAERFSVGWIVYTPAVGRQRNNEIYYVADDGELEETSSAAEPSEYIKSVEQRFWQRRALFG
ncbi:hypothetical protein AB4305_08370 [Nocardia sp. 2YAB30]|uniref:hypothetical protein n=1 Tax=unclassified Nocardia TaxID=2637762 RepID=UPI003F991034